jgi:hypothetical protein
MSMKEHPFSVWTLGGIPSGAHGVPSPTDLESWGATWSGASHEYLIGVAARAYGQNSETVSMPALIESQRRLADAIAVFEESARTRTQTLLEAQGRLLAAVDAFSDCTTSQNAQMIKLTHALRVLTVVLIGLGIIQIVLMVWQ